MKALAIDLRVWPAIIGLLALVGGTVCLLAYDTMARRFTEDLHDWAIAGAIWVISIPSVFRLRKMMIDQGNARK